MPMAATTKKRKQAADVGDGWTWIGLPMTPVREGSAAAAAATMLALLGFRCWMGGHDDGHHGAIGVNCFCAG